MRYLNLESIPTPLSRIAMGSTYLGSEIDESTTFRMLDTFAEHGGTTLDTARVYGQVYPGGASASEQVIGTWLRVNGMHHRMVIVTKGLHPTLEGRSRFTHQDLMNDINRSQDELQTDSIDIWFLHRDDPAIPVQEIVDMVAPLVRSHTIKMWGVSNWRIDRIAMANAYAQEQGLPPLKASEIQWSLASTTPEKMDDATLVCMDDESLAWYRTQKIPVFAFSSQAKGFFSKLLASGEQNLSEKSKHRFLSAENLLRAQRVGRICDETGMSPAAVTVGYVTNALPLSVAIVGASTVAQLEDTLQGADVVLDKNRLDFLTGR